MLHTIAPQGLGKTLQCITVIWTALKQSGIMAFCP
jgi:hypothetical protein